MTELERRNILARGRFNPPWRGEPLLGSTYGEEEIAAATAAIRAAMDVHRGFFPSRRAYSLSSSLVCYLVTTLSRKLEQDSI